MATQKGKAPTNGSDRYKKLLERLGQVEMGGSDFWKPPQGVSTIRILPPVGEMGDVFFVEVGQHYYEENAAPLYCPQIGGVGDCPLCQLNDALYRSGQKEAAKKFRPGRAFFMNIIDRKHPENGVQIWAPGTTVLGQLSSIISDPDYGDISDLEAGFDIKVERTGEDRQTKYQVRPARNPTPLSANQEDVDTWLQDATDLQDYVSGKFVSFEDMVKRAGLEDYFEGMADEKEEKAAKKAPAGRTTTPARKPVRKPEPDEDDEEEDNDEDAEDEAEDEEEPAAPVKGSATSKIKGMMTDRAKRAGLVRK